jgi:hypothetical protein
MATAKIDNSMKKILSRIDNLEKELAILKQNKQSMRTLVVGDLEWQADVPEKNFTLEEAKEYAASLGAGWRLPTIKELLTLVDYEKLNPACSVFPDCPSEWYWSSSAYSGSTTYAWRVCFNDGTTYNYDVSYTSRVRCVRSLDK